jgi:penicillin-binding protein-related factor A (putative recombinase)
MIGANCFSKQKAVYFLASRITTIQKKTKTFHVIQISNNKKTEVVVKDIIFRSYTKRDLLLFLWSMVDG